MLSGRREGGSFHCGGGWRRGRHAVAAAMTFVLVVVVVSKVSMLGQL